MVTYDSYIDFFAGNSLIKQIEKEKILVQIQFYTQYSITVNGYPGDRIDNYNGW